MMATGILPLQQHFCGCYKIQAKLFLGGNSPSSVCNIVKQGLLCFEARLAIQALDIEEN